MEKYGNYRVLDHPLVLERLFHPRREGPGRRSDRNREDVMIPIGRGIELGASLHLIDQEAPVVLFFHGNGEIVADYDDLGPFFTGIGVNFFVVDYRGYGRSSGLPAVSAMMRDCHAILGFLTGYMEKNSFNGPVCVMGRSLGSAPALELGTDPSVASVIVESGFAQVSPLLNILGIDADAIGFKEEDGFENIEKIKGVTKPCLIIHAQFDHLIPFSQGQALYQACGSATKFLLEIKGANHNDIFYRGTAPYLEQVKKFCAAPPG